MSESAFSRIAYKPDWRWIVASYAYLVLFHMLPVFLLGGMRAFHSAATESSTIVWLFFGLMLVSLVIGYRSRGFTVLEPAIAGFLYALTLTVGFDRFLGTQVPSEKTLAIVFWTILAFMICVVGAWIGELVQEWGKKREETAERPE